MAAAIASSVLSVFAAGISCRDDAYAHIEKREHNFACMQSPSSFEAESQKSGKNLRLMHSIDRYECTYLKDATGRQCYRYSVVYQMTDQEAKKAKKAENMLVRKAMLKPKAKRAEFLYRQITRDMRCDDERRQSYTPYGALVEKKACCEGASLAFADICSSAGIRCRVIVGKAIGEDHMWTALKGNGGWKYCDPAWDAGKKSPLYFARSAAYMRDHGHIFPKDEKK